MTGNQQISETSLNMWIYYAANITVVLLNPSSGQSTKHNKREAGETHEEKWQEM